MATILIVDDRPINRQFLLTLLGYGDHRLLEAADGEQALEQVRFKRPDLVITDILMPGMDGFRFTQQLRADPELADTKVIFYSATYSVPDAIKLAKTCGVSVVLPKPSDPSTILDAVNKALALKTAAPASTPPPTVSESGGETTLTHIETQISKHLRGLLTTRQGLDHTQGRDKRTAGSLKTTGNASEQVNANISRLHILTGRLCALIELRRKLMARHELQPMLEMFCLAARNIVNTERVTLLITDDTGQLPGYCLSANVDAEQVIKSEISPKDIVKLSELTDGDTLRMSGKKAETLANRLPGPALKAKNLLGIPVATETRRYGMLWLINRGSSEGFDVEDEEFAALLAAELALLLENLGFLHLVQQHAAALQLEDVERKKAERNIRRLNRVYAVLSGINNLIVRVRDRQELFEQACRIAVERGKFEIAWIGALNREAQEITAVAWAGLAADEYIGSVKTPVRVDAPFGQNLLTRAVGSSEPVVENDILGNSQTSGPRRQEQVRRGYRSAIALPLMVDGVAVGNMTLLSKEPNFFNKEEVGLLTELSTNISFALKFITLQHAIREEEQLLHNLMDNIPDSIYFKDLAHRFVRLNQAQARRYHLSRPADAIGKTIKDFVPLDRAMKIEEEDMEIFRTGRSVTDRVTPLSSSAGEVRWTSTTKAPIKDKNGRVTGLVGISRDVTERKLAEEKINRLNRVYAVLSGINALIVRAHEREELFKEACRIAVEDGKFGVAWIAKCDPVAQTLTPIAWDGTDAALITQVTPSKAHNSPLSVGPTSRAIREGVPVFINDMAVGLEVGSTRRREAIRLGYRSTIALPLLVNGTVTAVLTLYSKEPNFFDDTEVKLLIELASNISFALDSITKQQKLDKLARIRVVSSEINTAIVRIHDREALLRETCRIITEHGKFKLVWIAALDHEKQHIQPVAWAGFTTEVAHALNWASLNTPGGTLAEVIRTHKATVRNDLDPEVRAGKLRMEAMQKGYRSTVCLPFMVDDNVVATVILFAMGRGYFDEEELALLDEVAADVSFALQAIDKQKRLDYLAYYDALTGLPNRMLFQENLAQSLNTRKEDTTMISVVLFDLERFRQVNDSLGWAAGDELLRQVANRLKTANSSAGRLGPNAFAMTIRGVHSVNEITHMIEKTLTECFGEPIRLAERELQVGCKIGAAVFPGDGTDADTLLRNAEAALRRARTESERFVFYAPAMNARVAEIFAIENKVRLAVQRQEFVLHYQPKLTLSNGRITSAEALIRWNDPDSGLVPPGKFIPVLEETGLIWEVGRWAIERALTDILAWRAKGLVLSRVAVNVSPIQLQRKDFLASVIDAIACAGDNPEALELEITESVMMRNVEDSIRKLSILRGMGVQISIDDFGTGYSSLSYMTRLPIDTLKIDRSFVIDLADSGDSVAVASTIITLAHSFRLKVIAEGVETREQEARLVKMGCDEVQGYLYSKPVPAEAFEALLRAQQRGG